MKLVTFGIDNVRNLKIQFLVFVEPYTQARLTLYQIETVPVPILDTNNKAQSYTQLRIDKPYIAMNDETYISLCPQELNTCRKIGYKYFCEELFVVKSKYKYSCASAVYFNLNTEIKQNCDFDYYFNRIDITPSVLDGGQQIILANWPSYKRIICTYNNNNIPVNIPSHPYVLLDRNDLCNCDIEAENNFLLESLAACGEGANQNLEMYFTVNLAFLDHLGKLKEVIENPIDRNWTHEKQILPISLELFEMNSSLLQAPKMLRDYIKQYQEKKKMQVQRQNENTNSKFGMFITSFIVDIIGLMAAFLTVIMTLVIIYVLTGQSKLKTLVANIALQCVKAVEAAALNPHYTYCEFGLVKILMILNLGLVTFMALAKLKKSRIFKGRLFSKIIKIKLFIADN